MDKWPELKAKIGNAFKASASQTNETQANSNKTASQCVTNSKTPKIQLNFNFSKKLMLVFQLFAANLLMKHTVILA